MIDTLVRERSAASPSAEAPLIDAHVRLDMPGEGWTLMELYDRAAWEVAQIGKSRRIAELLRQLTALDEPCVGLEQSRRALFAKPRRVKRPK